MARVPERHPNRAGPGDAGRHGRGGGAEGLAHAGRGPGESSLGDIPHLGPGSHGAESNACKLKTSWRSKRPYW